MEAKGASLFEIDRDTTEALKMADESEYESEEEDQEEEESKTSDN